MSKIAIIVGSSSDLAVLESAKPYLEFFKLDHDIQVLSAHRQHDELVDYVQQSEKDGTRVIIACAGMAAHLPGVVAAVTNLPVIGVPLDASSLNGMDALLSIVQMPKGIPVATMAIGKAGVINAVVYAAKILALNDPTLRSKLDEFHNKGSKL
ncbi:5-(carboxyamino)imidazole ribonucleotide mutase [bacterium]|nr:5-(carboxyamino)imidazole ribonucleotide mutase [bacterium]MBU1063839.1 5-(carboxyamino)imidazole ribonucleotide mutase [bacterium]MBU1635653.1 5-(carboxyamino)imidazole ribonucleotide mutase [bacterium]MBU1872367.1 5-(carboxyamino)imidazole ribonucleotide mutase [bacterium]